MNDAKFNPDKLAEIVEQHKQDGDEDFQRFYAEFKDQIIPLLPKNTSMVKYHVMIRRAVHAFWLAEVKPIYENLNKELVLKPLPQ